MLQARLRRDYRSVYPDPIRLYAGQEVELGACDEQWPAFAWVRLDGGNAGWAPYAWLRPLGAGRAKALHDYDARELDAACGETVTLHHQHGGWWWCERADGAQGWLPDADLERLEEPLLE